MADKKIVLAIDDNLQQLNEFKSMLVPKYDLRTVKSASEAIAFLFKNPSDIILLDIEMPNINGFEFFKDIRRVPSYVSTPIIIVSGNSGAEFSEKCKKHDPAGILTKPVDPDTLIKTIEKALGA
ncbi:MAG: response regulator [Treponema sp.]|jgi:twitching motility two-component system response regulator PilG|nr:response regulator [Treponema sp.]